MSRPMTSKVSTLSGRVANSHQAMHFVSSAPSKIPYGGFSPVRLQTHLTPRPPSRAYPRPLIGRHCRDLVSRRFVRSWSCDQAAPRTSDHDRGSSGPWLPRPVLLSGQFIAYYGHICASCDHPTAYGLFRRAAGPPFLPASRRGSPIYSASPFTPCRRPYPGGPSDCARRPHYPTTPDQVGSVTRLQRWLHATAWSVAGPAPARTFTTELAWAGSPHAPSRL